MAGPIAPPRRSDDESEEDVRARMAVKRKGPPAGFTRSRTSLTAEQQQQALEDAFGDDPTHRKDPKADKIKAAHIAAHRENIRRGKAAKAQAARTAAKGERDAAAQARKDQAAAQAAAEARSFTGRSKRVGTVAGTVGDVTSGGGLRIDDTSGFVLALLAWSWVLLPYIRQDPTTGKMAGAAGVRNILRAKFFNKDANGQAMP